MSTRRWFGELESWLRRSGMTKEELAELSERNVAHVLGLFEQPDPNPSLELFLDLVDAAGARFHSVEANEPRAVIERLKEIMSREQVLTVSALAKVSGVNRSQLSSLLNNPDPNPSLLTFHRLVVALGAERDFVLVSKFDEVVARAAVAGEAEVRAVKQEVKARHLRAVPAATSVAGAERREREAERAAEQDARVRAKLAEVEARIQQLQQVNIALEKQRADFAAEIARLKGANATLERLRAEDAAEIARLIEANRNLELLREEDMAEIERLNELNVSLKRYHAAEIAKWSARNHWGLGKKIALGAGCFAAGAGLATLIARSLRPAR